PLSHAIRASSSDVVELLLKHGADSCQATKQGSTPLTLAITDFKENDDSLRKIQLLLNNGANPNQQNRQGRTPLMKAINKQQQAIVQVCIQHGANTNMPDSSGSFPLLLATQKKCIGIIRLLLANHADPNQETNSITPLKLALEIGDIPIAQLLVQHHANVNQQAKGVTLLAEFIKRQITPNVEFLLNAGADPYKESTIQTSPGITEEKTALKMGDETKNKEIIALIKDAIREKQKGTAETIMKIREEVDPDVARTIEEY
ncbi:MAG: ankyrin repeat domain-containing protein, partial [Candidatus Babeliales bacterium]